MTEQTQQAMFELAMQCVRQYYGAREFDRLSPAAQIEIAKYVSRKLGLT